MDTETSRWIMALLRVGTAGYLLGAVAWSLFWLGLASNYVGKWIAYLPVYLVFFAVSLSLVMVGGGCFALSKLVNSGLAAATGVADVAAAAFVFMMGLFYQSPFAPRVFLLWPYGYI